MTYTSPELIPIPAESVKDAGLSAGSRHLEPDGVSCEDRREDRADIFDLQFSRSRRLLFFVARRILNCVTEAEEAVKNCRLTASCNPPAFSTEGAFKSWLVRILIDEATLLLRKRQSNATASTQPLLEAVRKPLTEGR